ncbi:hypothetical protein AA0118_g1467 [Alternaria tenuissima]|nr:hypothetical protein AA0118_g1467 [Alternaria tenuissima]
MDAATVVSIILVIVFTILAIVSLLDTVAVAIVGHISNKCLAEEAGKAAIDQDNKSQELNHKYELLKQELHDRKETEALIYNKAHLGSKEGLQDLKQYTCYKLAQYFAWSHVLRMKAKFFSFCEDEELKKVGTLILCVEEGFDRRRGYDAYNLGVWPGSRILVAERMLLVVEKDKVATETTVKGFHTFLKEWDTLSKEPMGYYCQWIDDLVVARKARFRHWEDALRCTQHHLVDLVKYLDRNEMYQHIRKIKKKGIWCNCESCTAEEQRKALVDGKRPPMYRRRTVTDRKKILADRSDSRYTNRGLRPWYRYDKWDPDYDDTIDLDRMLEMTCTAGFDQKLYPGVWNRTMNWKEMHWWEEDYGTNSDDGHSVNEDFEKLQSHEKLHKEGQAKIKVVFAK